jgi:hypothetical protein
MDIDRSPRKLNADWCKELSAGNTPYFTVSYPEPGMNFPQIETLIYLGATEMSDEDGGPPCIGFMFQDARSYIEDGDWSTLPEARQGEIAAEFAVMSFSEDSVGSVADIDGLVVLLSGLRERMRRGLGWDMSLPPAT